MGSLPETGSIEHAQELTELMLRTIMRGSRFIRQIMEPFFDSFGISVSQWVVMRVIMEQEIHTGRPVRLVDLSNLLMIRQPTLTAAINKLVLMGLVERVNSEAGSRGRMVSLSAQGKALWDELLARHRSRIRELFGVWNNEEKELILNLFDKLVQHLITYIPPDPGLKSRYSRNKTNAGGTANE